MAEAYILINCEIGSEEEVITALKNYRWHKRSTRYIWCIWYIG